MHYQILGPTGLRVSPICLGTMGFGTEWGWGVDYQTSKQVFEAFANAGGNFIDTANRYTEGSSERFLGDFMKGNREHFVLATKYSLYDRQGDPNFAGNHRKNLFRSLKASLERLQTDYIDLLYIHAWDFTTPIEAVMRSLNDVVRQGLVHHIAISDTPAWIVAAANTLAQQRGWEPFSVMQAEYSLTQRTPERELIPMADHFGMGIAPWAPLAGGVLTGKYFQDPNAGRIKEESERRNEKNTAIARTVVEVAQEVGCSPAQAAIAWNRQKHPQIVPIAGARKVHQIEDVMGATQYCLSNEQMARLDEISATEMGFPHDFLSRDSVKNVLFAGTYEQVRL